MINVILLKNIILFYVNNFLQRTFYLTFHHFLYVSASYGYRYIDWTIRFLVVGDDACWLYLHNENVRL